MIHIVYEPEGIGGLLKVEPPALSLVLIIEILDDMLRVKATYRGVVAAVVGLDKLQRDAGVGLCLCVV